MEADRGQNIAGASAAGAPPARGSHTRAEWIQPPAEEQGLARLVRTLRERALVVIAAVLLATAATVLVVGRAEKVYEAEANLLINPVTGEDTTLSSLGLLRQSADPLRPVQTAAVLATTSEVARNAAARLGVERDPLDLLKDVRAEPVAESNLVAITASAGSPEEARELANAFAGEAVAGRTRRVQQEVRALVRSLETQLARVQVGAPGEAAALEAQLAQLRTLREAPTPDMRVETLAELPNGTVAPRPVLSVLGGILAGLVIGIGGAFALDSLDPRLRREQQLRRLFRLPILARIPREPGQGDRPLIPSRLSPATTEAYRTLRATLASARYREPGKSRAILVTGSSPSEGKSTTAINLAASLALAGNRTILVDADLRRPSIGRAMGVRAHRGVVGVLIENVGLHEALVPVPGYGPGLEVLPAEQVDGWVTELFALPSAQHLLEEARRRADYVVIDAPPLTEVVDALPFARSVDDVLVVARLGKTRTRSILQLAELLAENGIEPAGLAVVGSERPSESDYHYYEEAPGRTRAPEPHRLLARPASNGARPGAGGRISPARKPR